ncbi:MAG: signal peptidase I [Alphaproteobacteria bacterium]
MKNTRKKPSNWEAIRSFGYAVLLALLFRSVAFEPFHIPSGSMLPTLKIGEYICVSKLSYGYSRYSFPFGAHIPYFEGRIFASEPVRGDIIVFRTPQNTSVDYIKRLIGLPGDKIQVIEGVLYVNGIPVSLRKVPDYREDLADGGLGPAVRRYQETLPGGRVHDVIDERPYGNIDGNGFDSDNTDIYTVPEGYYFFMGDNRDNSVDSRFSNDLGFVPVENLVGRAEMIFFSFKQGVAIWEFWRWPSAFDNARWFRSLRS